MHYTSLRFDFLIFFGHFAVYLPDCAFCIGIKRNSFCVSEKPDHNQPRHQPGVSAESRNSKKEQDKAPKSVPILGERLQCAHSAAAELPEHPQRITVSCLSWGREWARADPGFAHRENWKGSSFSPLQRVAGQGGIVLNQKRRGLGGILGRNCSL